MRGTLAERIKVDNPEQWADVIEQRGWGDGLPMVLPTPHRVDEFIAASGRSADEIVGYVAPVGGEATIEKIAINAVMAGCLPPYMKCLVTAVEALLDARFNLLGVQATTHPCATLLLVSGPEAKRLSMNSGAGAFGPGFRANASLGRAVRLLMMNLGGARPGHGDMSTQGSPAKYSFCIAENEAATPWDPYRVQQGYAQEDSTVTVAALEPPHNVGDHGSTTAEDFLLTCVGVMGAPSNQLYLMGTDPFFFLCPEHAHKLNRDGYTPQRIQRHLFEHALILAERVGKGQLSRLRRFHEKIASYRQLGLDDPYRTTFPIVTDPSDINIVVVGGPHGGHSSFSPSIGAVGHSVTMRIPA